MNAQLTAAQHFLLAHAAEFHDGKIVNFPEGVHGNARQKMLQGLLARRLVRVDGSDWFVTDNGCAAIGREIPRTPATNPDLEAAVATAETQWQPDAIITGNAADGGRDQEPIQRTIRPGSKLAEIVDAMKRPGGATLAELMAGTGWQAHTIRGAISGTVRKKLGYQVVTEKGADGRRGYRIA